MIYDSMGFGAMQSKSKLNSEPLLDDPSLISWAFAPMRTPIWRCPQPGLEFLVTRQALGRDRQQPRPNRGTARNAQPVDSASFTLQRSSWWAKADGDGEGTSVHRDYYWPHSVRVANGERGSRVRLLQRSPARQKSLRFRTE